MNENQLSEPDYSWMRLAIQAKPVPDWRGDLNDDCTALWAGFTLRAELMNGRVWWWAVYLDAQNLQIASSNDSEASPLTGDEARAAAVRAVLSFLNLNPN